MEENNELSIKDIFQYIIANIKYFVVGIVLSVILVIVLFFSKQKIYTTTSSILVVPVVDKTSQSYYDEAQSIIRTMNSYLNKDTVKKGVIDNLSLDLTVNEFDKKYHFRTGIDNSFIDISVTSNDVIDNEKIIKEALSIALDIKERNMLFDANVSLAQDIITKEEKNDTWITYAFISVVVLFVTIVIYLSYIDSKRKNIKYSYTLKKYANDRIKILSEKNRAYIIKEALKNGEELIYVSLNNTFFVELECKLIENNCKNIVIIEKK